MTSGEYIQMSGRAGRRGKDPCGTCIIIANEELEEETCRDITTGERMCAGWVCGQAGEGDGVGWDAGERGEEDRAGQLTGCRSSSKTQYLGDVVDAKTR